MMNFQDVNEEVFIKVATKVISEIYNSDQRYSRLIADRMLEIILETQGTNIDESNQLIVKFSEILAKGFRSHGACDYGRVVEIIFEEMGSAEI